MNAKDPLIQPDRGQDAIAIHLITSAQCDAFMGGLTQAQRAALQAQKFTGEADQTAILSDGDGWMAVGGVEDDTALRSYCLAKLAQSLPAGTYRLVKGGEAGAAMLGWQTAQYRFSKYKQNKALASKGDTANGSAITDAQNRDKNAQQGARILLTKQVRHIDPAIAEAQAEMLVRDLVNTPAEDMGPSALEAEAERMAKAYSATLRVTKGDALAQEYPMIHAVGRAATREHAPRLIELEWGPKDAPRVALVGKGVSFDSGGLDVKSAAGMRLMKKDMGGAAHVLALAELIMRSSLNLRLHMLVPAAENAISSNAFRPGDVLQSRAGLQVEITNTDAEGRLLLGDALTRACEEAPDLLVDFATLTGAARVALGPDLPALMTREDTTAAALIEQGEAHDDPLWRLPLYGPYSKWLKSDIADLMNSHENAYAGASVAGLFLERFVDEGIEWAHLDTFAWCPFARPGRSKGGAAYGLRAAFHMIKNRYGSA